MQKKRPGRDGSTTARGVTQQEFIDFMKRAQEAVYARLLDPHIRVRWEIAVGPWGRPGNDPIFSFDHPNVHGGKKPGVVMHAMGLTLRSHFMLPCHSCDIHRVIEHTHARLVKKFQDWLFEDDTVYNLDRYKRELEKIFYNNTKVAGWETIGWDVAGLPELFEELVRIRGGWPASCWR